MPRVRHLPARDLALVALFAALMAALGLPGAFTLFGNAVPITAQTLGVMLAGSILGAKRGFLAVAAFDLLVLAGLPLLGGGRGGLPVLFGPSAGYFLAFPLGAFVIGWLTEKGLALARGRRHPLAYGFIANLVGGIGVVYAIGIPVQAARTGTSVAVAAVAAAVFLPGDLIKSAVATVIASRVHAGYPLLPHDDQARRVHASHGRYPHPSKDTETARPETAQPRDTVPGDGSSS
ncbi:MAG TPA: biotin transporter BioY [Actinopolymorphaceae bacterium]|jgi:biotin transport system substrate-specific component